MKQTILTFILLLAWGGANASEAFLAAATSVETIVIDSVPAQVAVPPEADPESSAQAQEETVATALSSLTLLDSDSLRMYAGPSHNYMDYISPKYGYYTPAKEFFYTPLPLVLGGLLAKASNKNLRTAASDLEPKSHNVLDNYGQYLPLTAVWGLKAAGVEGRSSWSRFVVSNVFSVAMMAGLTEGVKHSAKELRPDGSDHKSFPSGHTATAFMAATILHKEYGLTRSPWYSVGGYTVATATGLMRAANNRHWVSDILVGAGIGIISTDLGYLFADLIFKDKGIIRSEKEGLTDIRQHPSFFSSSIGYTKPLGTLKVEDNVMEEVYNILPQAKGLTKDNLLHPRLKLGPAATVNVEGAFFINPYVGFGGKLEVASMPVLADNLNVYKVDVFSPDGSRIINNPYTNPYTAENVADYLSSDKVHRYSTYPGHDHMQAVDNLPLCSVQLGVYGSLPVSRRCALGAKVLAGPRIAGSCSLNSYTGFIPDKYITCDFRDLDINNPDDHEVLGVLSTTAYESIDLDVKNSFALTTGVSFTVMMRQNMGCRLYVDYSNSRFNYDITYKRTDMPTLMGLALTGNSTADATALASSTHKRSLNTISGGVSIELHF